eukprot:3629754-Prymnesium_polylepis.1
MIATTTSASYHTHRTAHKRGSHSPLTPHPQTEEENVVRSATCGERTSLLRLSGVLPGQRSTVDCLACDVQDELALPTLDFLIDGTFSTATLQLRALEVSTGQPSAARRTPSPPRSLTRNDASWAGSGTSNITWSWCVQRNHDVIPYE